VTDAADCAPSLTLNGPVVKVTGGGNTSPPASTGGVISQGIYALTAATVYPAPSGAMYGTAQTTLQISGGQFQEMDSGSGSTATTSGTWMTGGTKLTLFESCPTTTTYTWQYTASSGTLSVTVPPMNGSTVTVVETFTLQ
jgi:hypothetical protein